MTTTETTDPDQNNQTEHPDFDQAAHPDRLRRLWDPDPQKSVVQPGGALFNHLTNGRPTVDRDLPFDLDDVDLVDRVDPGDVDITTWDTPTNDFDNASEPIILRPTRAEVEQITVDWPDVLDDGTRGYFRTMLYIACIPTDTHPMWFGAILDHFGYVDRGSIDGNEAKLQQDIGGDEASAAYWSDPLAYWEAEKREARERARYLRRQHGDDLTNAEALCVASIEQGFKHGNGPLLDVADGTVKRYHESVEDTFGELNGWVPHEERFGPLDQTDETANKLSTDRAPTTEEVAERDGRTIPQDLLDVARWICWKLEKREDKDGNLKWAKIPKAPWNYVDGDADANDKDNWTDYATASDWAEKLPGKWGIGYVFAPVGPFVGIDFDDCRDSETGAIDAWVLDIIERADSFAQISTSGTGVHVFLRGKLDGAEKNEAEGIEIYDRGRYFAMTGDHIPNTPVEIREDQDLIDELVDEYGTDSDDSTIGGDPLEIKRIHRDNDVWSPFELLKVTDIYPDIPVGDRVGHPEHGSSTGKNFVISARNDGKTGTCWKGAHAWGKGDGCGLNAAHLLAMRALQATNPDSGSKDYEDAHNCRKIRKRYADDDYLVYLAYKYAVQADGLDFDTNPPPWRAIRYIDQHHAIGEDGLDSDDPADRHLAFTMAIRILGHEIGVELDTDPTPVSERVGDDDSDDDSDDDNGGDDE